MWTKVARDNLKAILPFKERLRRTVRSVSPYSSLPANDALAVSQGLQLLCLTRKYNVSLESVLEVGTGWVPTLPHMLKACGAGRLILTDIEHLSDANTARHARILVEQSLGRLAEASDIDTQSLKANLARPGLEDYRCPPALEQLRDHSVTLIYSRAVLEHIPKPTIEDLFREWRRLLMPGGACIHFIDNSDHFEHTDKRLSRLNFLTVSDWAWRFACLNPQNYQNRLRHSDYLVLFRDAGYELLHSEGEPDPQARADLNRLVLNRRFTRYDKDDLAILTSMVVARKPVSPESYGTSSGSEPNQLSLRHSSRKRPIRLSTKAFWIGLPG